MKKNLYSLILSEDVINEIDKLAYAKRTNRSNMINQILADYVSYVTPEKHTEQIFNSLENIINTLDTFQIFETASKNAFQMRTALAFKYNPSIRYNIELNPDISDKIGKLKVSFRTQNDDLLSCLVDFFKLWQSLENTNPGVIQDDKYIKNLVLDNDIYSYQTNEIAHGISCYINTFDEAIKKYFYNLPYPDFQEHEVKKIYYEYIQTNPIIK